MSNYDDGESFAADDPDDEVYEFRISKVVLHGRLQEVMDEIPSGALRAVIAHRLLTLLYEATVEFRGGP